MASDQLQVANKHARRAGQKVALLFVDLDDFKAVNDSDGHAVGDHVLQQAAQRLRQVVREKDTVAGVGGDEFVTVMRGIAEPADAERLARVFNAAVARPIEWLGAVFQVIASVGISQFPDHADDADAMRRTADAAMYRVKKSGCNHYAFARAVCALAKRA